MLSWGDFSPIVDRCLPELPGITRAYLKKICADIFSEFCYETWCWKETFDIYTVAQVTQYEVIPDTLGAIPIGIEYVMCGDNKLGNDDWVMVSPNEIEIVNSAYLGERVSVRAIIQSDAGFEKIPKSIQSLYSAQLAVGVNARCMLQSDKPWANPNRGLMLQGQWERSLLRIASDIKEGFSVTRQGRPHRPQSYYF